jgi:hypothetical protein
MQKLLTIGTMFAALSGFAMAETWSGTLVDANCVKHHKATKSCDAKGSTTVFALDADGKTYYLDTASNDAARQTLASRKEDGNKSKPVGATIVGKTRSSGKLHAERIELQ